jgi:GNAT superfamily N-acetyltransferase
MLELDPMSQVEYSAFMALSTRSFMEDQVKAGNWEPDRAEMLMQAMLDRFLSDGLHTPDQYFYSLKTERSETVGGLWFLVMERGAERFAFVMDIQVFEEHRRKGFGSQAFMKLEELAGNLGVNRIMLNVHEHNRSARAMYEKLGYSGSATEMSKSIP